MTKRLRMQTIQLAINYSILLNHKLKVKKKADVKN